MMTHMNKFNSSVDMMIKWISSSTLNLPSNGAMWMPSDSMSEMPWYIYLFYSPADDVHPKQYSPHGLRILLPVTGGILECSILHNVWPRVHCNNFAFANNCLRSMNLRLFIYLWNATGLRWLVQNCVHSKRLHNSGIDLNQGHHPERRMVLHWCLDFFKVTIL